MPTASEQMKDLRKEAEQARGNATLLMEAVAFADPKEELSSNEIVQVGPSVATASAHELTSTSTVA